MDISFDRKRLTLSAGELARLVAESADTSNPIAFSLRGRLGAEAHRAYQDLRRASEGFRREVHLDVTLAAPQGRESGWEVRVRGRLDGLVEELDRLVVEELKTVALPAGRFAALAEHDIPRHRRQLEIYLHLLAATRPDKPAAGRLIYLNLPNSRRKAFEVEYRREEIEPVIWDMVGALIDREARRAGERVRKRETAAQLRFPFLAPRPGQEEIIAAVRQTLDRSGTLLVEAPTGLGKTAAALFAALPRALEQGRQVLYLTAKTTQQDLVFRTAQDVRLGRDFPRVALLRARQKICPQEAQGAEPENCPYREDFPLRLRRSGLLERLLAEGAVHPDRVRELGEQERLCPHELQLLLAEEADLVIGDYNYAFDPGARLERLFSEGEPSRLILLVDEAHNLPDRARGYYSPRLPWFAVEAAAGHLQARGI